MKCPTERGGCGKELALWEGAFCNACIAKGEEINRLKKIGRPTMPNEKRYRVEPETDCDGDPMDGHAIIDSVLNRRANDWTYGSDGEAGEECDLYNAIYESGLAVNEPYRLAWEDAIIFGPNTKLMKDIAARRGIREE